LHLGFAGKQLVFTLGETPDVIGAQTNAAVCTALLGVVAPLVLNKCVPAAFHKVLQNALMSGVSSGNEERYGQRRKSSPRLKVLNRS
jgi:hypothetical protein